MSTIAQPIFEDDADIDIWEVKKNNIKKNNNNTKTIYWYVCNIFLNCDQDTYLRIQDTT